MTNALQAENVKELQVRPAAPLTPMDMLARAVDSGAGLEMVEKLMGLQERWEANQARKSFEQALAAAKAEIKPVARNKEGHNKKRYADFSAYASVVDPILSSHGLQYRFRTQQTEKAITVTCILFGHGHSEETTLSGPADLTGNKNPIQAIGSTLTYLQRYSLVQMLGLAAADDDDGKAALSGPAISQDQADTLRELLEVHGKDRAKFLKWAKVEQIEDIPEGCYSSCVEAIKAPVRK